MNWEEKISKLVNNPWKEVEEYIKQKIEECKNALVNSTDLEEIIRLQEKVKVYQELVNLPEKLKVIYTRNKEVEDKKLKNKPSFGS